MSVRGRSVEESVEVSGIGSGSPDSSGSGPPFAPAQGRAALGPFSLSFLYCDEPPPYVYVRRERGGCVPVEVVKFKEADDTHIAGKVWAHVENSREGDADLESIYEAGLPALTKTIAAKNSNYFSHGKKSEAILAMDARKAELAQAEAI